MKFISDTTNIWIFLIIYKNKSLITVSTVSLNRRILLLEIKTAVLKVEHSRFIIYKRFIG